MLLSVFVYSKVTKFNLYSFSWFLPSTYSCSNNLLPLIALPSYHFAQFSTKSSYDPLETFLPLSYSCTSSHPLHPSFQGPIQGVTAGTQYRGPPNFRGPQPRIEFFNDIFYIMDFYEELTRKIILPMGSFILFPSLCLFNLFGNKKVGLSKNEDSLLYFP